MKISVDFLVRIGGMLALAYLGSEIGVSLSKPMLDSTQYLATQLLMLAGAGLGLLITPRITIEPIRSLLKLIRTIALDDILTILAGGLMGLIVGVLLTVPIALLPAPLNNYLPLANTLVLMYIGAVTFFLHKKDLQEGMRQFRRSILSPVPFMPSNVPTTLVPIRHRYLLDTSAIIDGRIAMIGNTGFLDGTLLVPQFVLVELQTLADSNDDLRRSKGRRGLELLTQMQKDSAIPVEIVEGDIHDLVRVDDKLVMLARQYQCPIITNDFNLNRVAELQGVKVLNLNALSDAIRPPVIQDQRLHVLIRNEGNSRQQGVGYLADGTPVIIEDARHLIGQTVEVIVTRLHQTQTGRLVFAHMADEPPEERRR